MDDNAAPGEKATLFCLEELDGLTMLEANYHRRRFPRHVHETFCVGVIETGAQRFWRSGGDHVAPSGDIILVNADEVHTGCSEVEGGWSYRAIYPHPDLFARLSPGTGPAAVPWFPDAVLHDPALSAQLRLLFSLLPEQGNTLLKESLLLTAFAWLVMRYSRTRVVPAAVADATRAVLPVRELMAAHPEQNWSLQQLAEIAGLSPWYFLRQFKKSLGMTPHAWLLQQRLCRAREGLDRGEAIAQVSLRCGFSDQSHFTRHFKNSIGITPGDYVQARRGQPLRR
ncbi:MULTISPECIES: AraC family transcriptional regulator [unclassified Erwinia]|uniref:AraC family transcriptional regulator n=1 Tax=unclassified Erwinia TaxID=2622719 RepID=UPI0006FB4D83|nr:MULTISPECIES: AraC family transcriptional regulator [unclassified Erwinia]KQN64056.1 AraC family transcriptional regulator [Erwinia sp. Leaf53]